VTEEIRQGDVLARLREMPSRSVQCVVTSPPYYGLRDYGTDAWEGGDPECDHKLDTAHQAMGATSQRAGRSNVEAQRNENYREACGKCGARRVSPWEGGDPDCDHRRNKTPGAGSMTVGQAINEERGRETYRDVCPKCGARRAGRWTGGDPACDHSMARARIVGNAPSLKSTLTTNSGAGPRPGDKFHADQRREVATECPCGARWTTSQLGLEPSPDEYVTRLVEIFREVRRVLRDDGVAWLNLGDSYNNRSVARPSSHQGGLGFSNDSIERSWADQTKLGLSRLSLTGGGLKEKDLLGIPWMVAFALRDDGWFLRSDVIWAKPNPMPESVTDRPTNAHEHVFLLTKSARYFYDAEAIREKAKDWSRGGPGTGIANTADRYGAGNGGNAGLASLAARYRNQARGASGKVGRVRGGTDDSDSTWSHRTNENGTVPSYDTPLGGRNKRNVWEIPTQPYAEAHFATFPTRLVEPCVLAGSSPKACGQCGAPWQRVIEAETVREYGGTREMGKTPLPVVRAGWRDGGPGRETLGWEPSCRHQDDSGRCLVLDPFAGSGTVGVVVRWHGRNFIGIELNADYCVMARRRILLEGNPGRRAAVADEPIPGQMAMDFD
jgi:DNA modification methylase